MRALPRLAPPRATGPRRGRSRPATSDERAHRHRLGVEGRRASRARRARRRAPTSVATATGVSASRCSRRIVERAVERLRCASASAGCRARARGRGRDGGQPPLDRLPGDLQVRERERRPSRRPAGRRAARRPRAPPSRPGTTATTGRSSAASSAARASVRAAIPCTPASPHDTSATRAPPAARRSASSARADLLAHRAADDLLLGAQQVGALVDVRGVADDDLGLAHRARRPPACGAPAPPGPRPTMSRRPLMRSAG